MTAPEKILLTRQDVEAMLSISRSKIYALIMEGRFPEPIKLTPGPKGASRWRKDEIEAWLAEQERAGLTRQGTAPYRAA